MKVIKKYDIKDDVAMKNIMNEKEILQGVTQISIFHNFRTNIHFWSIFMKVFTQNTKFI